MARRLFNGNAFSEDGWPYVDDKSCRWVQIAANARIQIQDGIPAIVMGAFARDYDAYIEPIFDADSACWTPGNSVATSNHPGGTAMDLRWDSHPFQKVNTFNAAQQATIGEMLDWYEDMIFWGGRWDSPKDEMHWQMGYGTYDTDNDRPNPKCQDFINRKIRSYGFSTFRRGDAPPQPAVMTVPLVQNANGTWTSPSPAWAHLIRRESGGNPTIIQQIIDVNSGGNEAEGLFQITPRTWRAHGGDEFAPSPRLASPEQQAIVAARIFTRNPSGSDWGAGLPGREDANQLAAGLVPTTPTTPPPLPGDDMALVPQEQWDRVYRELTQRLPSRSPLRHLGEGLVDTMAGMLLNTDSSQHVEIVKLLASLGHPESLALLREVAAADPARYPDRQSDKLIAQAILADLNQPHTQAPAPAAPVFTPPVVYESPPPVTNGKPKNTGDTIGNLYTALEEMHLADALPIEARAPLAALIAVLQTKNGSQV